jgi:hypothetical protein
MENKYRDGALGERPSRWKIPQNLLGERRELQFVRSVLIILTLTALLKLQASYGSSRILNEEDALFAIPYRTLLFLSALAEIGCVLLLTSKLTSALTKTRLIALISSSFLLYHVAMWAVGAGNVCPCLGTLFERVPLREGTLSAISGMMALYMFVGSIFFIVKRLRHRAKVSTDLDEMVRSQIVRDESTL